MVGTLIQPCRVQDDCPMGCKLLLYGKIMTVALEEAPAKFVPAAAVIRMGQALFGITGLKACVGGFASQT